MTRPRARRRQRGQRRTARTHQRSAPDSAGLTSATWAASGRQRRFELVAAAGHQRRAADEEERAVGAESRGRPRRSARRAGRCRAGARVRRAPQRHPTIRRRGPRRRGCASRSRSRTRGATENSSANASAARYARFSFSGIPRSTEVVTQRARRRAGCERCRRTRAPGARWSRRGSRPGARRRRRRYRLTLAGARQRDRTHGAPLPSHEKARSTSAPRRFSS